MKPSRGTQHENSHHAATVPLIRYAIRRFPLGKNLGRAFVASVRRIVSISSLGLAWLCANGALWDAVQVFAWAKMVRDYAQVMPLDKAVAKVFDGSASCELCVVVDDAKAAQPLQSSERTNEKLVLVCEPAGPIIILAPTDAWPAAPARTALARTQPVALRPPRLV